MLTSESIKFFKTLNFFEVFILYIFYLTILTLFIIGEYFAFNAYHIGSLEISDARNSKKMDEIANSGKCYVKIRLETVLGILSKESKITKDHLIEQLQRIVTTNRELNIQKSNNILLAFKFTMAAIVLLLLMSLYIAVMILNALR